MATWHLVPKGLASKGTLELVFAPVRPSERDATPWRGTTAAFARICAERNPQDPEERLVPLSNVCCVLLDIVG